MSRLNGRTWTEFSRMIFICSANEMKPVANGINKKAATSMQTYI